MYNKKVINELVEYIESLDGYFDKTKLSSQVKNRFRLVNDRSVFYCNDFSIRFCSAKTNAFSNTVLSLSALQKYDSKPFIVCFTTQARNHLFLSNSTFIKKISHSSQELRIDNIRGSFNGSDIMKSFEGVENSPKNFDYLFSTHENFTFNENLLRLVESTNTILPTGKRFVPSDEERTLILSSVERAKSFIMSEEYKILNRDLEDKVNDVSSEIAIAAFIDNVNLRGRIIEYLITSKKDLKRILISSLHSGNPLPDIFTADELGDYERIFDDYITETDIKTKILFLSSNPKGYNVDKMLSFLSQNKSVYLVYIVAIDKNRNISTRLCSMYNKQLLDGTRIIKHWAGRNSRGVTQYDGASLEEIVSSFDFEIDTSSAIDFIKSCLQDE